MSNQAVLEAPAVTELALVDLSSISYPVWHMSGAQPDPDYTSTQIVARVRSLTAAHPKAAICCDSGKSFRHEIAPDYKAQREAAPQALHHQITLAKERLEADGYPVWSVKGFEADDLIASAATAALGVEGVTVLILSADKDLLQLVGPRVRVISVTNGNTYDAAAVVAKFGVRPDQMRDYLSLVGDPTDNVKGAKGVGAKTAAKLLAEHDSINGLYTALHEGRITGGIANSLTEFADRVETVTSLIALRTDVPLPIAELDNDRAAKAAPMEAEDMAETIEDKPADAVEQMPTHVVQAAAEPVTLPVPAAAREEPKPAPEKPNGNRAPDHAQPLTADVLAPASQDWSKQLEPRSIREAITLSNHLFQARLFSQYPTPQAILAAILSGRALGLPAMAALRAFHPTEKLPMAADMLRGLVLSSGKVRYFRCTERTPARATFEAQRDEDPPMSLSYTIEEARQAWQTKEKDPVKIEQQWLASNYGRNPADMLVARAGMKLARLVCPDVAAGLYAPEEF